MNESNVTLTLTRQQFEYVMNVLAQRPYAEVAPLLAELAQQTRDTTPPPKLVEK